LPDGQFWHCQPSAHELVSHRSVHIPWLKPAAMTQTKLPLQADPCKQSPPFEPGAGFDGALDVELVSDGGVVDCGESGGEGLVLCCPWRESPVDGGAGAGDSPPLQAQAISAPRATTTQRTTMARH
jgi:hypothetical protein